jgi:hexosaminidase
MLSMSACSKDVSDFHIIPFPADISPGHGDFQFTDAVEIFLSEPANEELQRLGSYTSEMLHRTLGISIPVAHEHFATGAIDAILLRITHERSGEGSEGYRLVVNPGTITISASSGAGLFYGIQTLLQLPFGYGQHVGEESQHGDTDSEHATAGDHQSDPDEAVWTTRAVSIKDSPRFPYRGLHLDVGRHFFPVDFIKRYIDLMAMYKLNRFHWHLTEDQGWRIEIQRYPRLTEVGANRSETLLEKNHDPYVGDGIPYGGFYTQDDVREIVRHAESRYVTVIPEIEMPGHSQAALAAYPELGCTDGPFEVSTRWGVHEEIYCPSEETFTFLEDVLVEVMDLFPSKYIHIGGDEAPKTRWAESDLAQEVIRREGLADEHELQSYFIRRVEAFLNSHGRKLIGWDEILEGGLAPDATVMSWRGVQPGVEAARQGHNVIMTPTSHMYFDYYQADPQNEPLAIGGHLPLDTVYAFEPVPDSLSWIEGHRVLGAQANVWTEYLKTTEYVEYMVFPRAFALAEVVWSPKEKRNWEFFVSRLPSHFELLNRLGVNYRPIDD